MSRLEIQHPNFERISNQQWLSFYSEVFPDLAIASGGVRKARETVGVMILSSQFTLDRFPKCQGELLDSLGMFALWRMGVKLSSLGSFYDLPNEEVKLRIDQLIEDVTQLPAGSDQYFEDPIGYFHYLTSGFGLRSDDEEREADIDPTRVAELRSYRGFILSRTRLSKKPSMKVGLYSNDTKPIDDFWGQGMSSKKRSVYFDALDETVQYANGYRNNFSENHELALRNDASPVTSARTLREYGIVSKRRKLFLMRQDRLVVHAEQELQDFEHGLVSKLSTTNELAIAFGLSYTAVRKALQSRNLLEARARIQEIRALERFIPSDQTAYFLGYLSVSGTINAKNHTFSVVIKDPDARTFFMEVAQSVGKLNLVFDEKTHEAYSTNSVLALAIGDLRRFHWLKTLQTKHGWIFADQEYTKAFLSGLIDGRSSIVNNRMSINFEDQDTAVFIASLLKSIGIYNPHVKHTDHRDGVMIQVRISNIADLRRVNQILTLHNSKKKRLLDVSGSKRGLGEEVTRITDEEIVAAWRIARTQYGENVTISKWDALRERGIITISADAVCDRFGLNEAGRQRFALARARLNELTS